MSERKSCVVEGCDRPADVGRGRVYDKFCSMHRRRISRTGSPHSAEELHESWLHDALDWVMDGEPLTHPSERNEAA